MTIDSSSDLYPKRAGLDLIRWHRGESLESLQSLFQQLRLRAANDTINVERLGSLLRSETRSNALASVLKFNHHGAFSDKEPVGKELWLELELQRAHMKGGPEVASNRREPFFQIMQGTVAEISDAVKGGNYEKYLESQKGRRALELVLKGGLSVFYLTYDPARRLGRYYWVVSDLIQRGRAVDMINQLTIPQGHGTFGWAMTYFERCARRNPGFIENPRAIALSSTLADLCGRVALEDQFAGKNSALLYPVMRPGTHRPLGIIYITFPVEGLFFDDELGSETNFVRTTVPQIVAESRAQLVTCLDGERRSLLRAFYEGRASSSDAAVGEGGELLKTLLPSGEVDPTGFLMIGSATYRDGETCLDFRLRERDFLQRLFHQLLIAAQAPCSWLPGYVTVMEEMAKDSQVHFQVTGTDEDRESGLGSMCNLAEGLNLYAFVAGSTNISLPFRKGRDFQGALRINFRKTAIMFPVVQDALVEAAQIMGNTLGELLDWFDTALSQQADGTEQLNSLHELRRELCEILTESIASTVSNGDEHIRRYSNPLFEEAVATLLRLDPSRVTELSTLIESLFDGLESFTRDLATIWESEQGKQMLTSITLVSLWAYTTRFTLDLSYDPSETGVSPIDDGLFRREPTLVDFLPRLLQLMQLHGVSSHSVSMRGPGYTRLVGPDSACTLVSPPLTKPGDLRIRFSPDQSDDPSAIVEIFYSSTSEELQWPERLAMQWRQTRSLQPVALTSNSKPMQESMTAAVEELGSVRLHFDPVFLRSHDPGEAAQPSLRGSEPERSPLSYIFDTATANGKRVCSWLNRLVLFMEDQVGTGDHPADDRPEPVWRWTTTQEGSLNQVIFAYGLVDPAEDPPLQPSRQMNGELAAPVPERSAESKGVLAQLRDEALMTMVLRSERRNQEEQTAKISAMAGVDHNRLNTVRYIRQSLTDMEKAIAADDNWKPHANSMGTSLSKLEKAMRRIRKAVSEDQRAAPVRPLKSINIAKLLRNELAPGSALANDHVTFDLTHLDATKDLENIFILPDDAGDVIDNIVGNAVEHALNPSSGQLGCVRIRIEKHESPGLAKLIVENSGPPAEPGALAYRVNRARFARASGRHLVPGNSTKSHHLGLGLSVLLRVEHDVLHHLHKSDHQGAACVADKKLFNLEAIHQPGEPLVARATFVLPLFL